MTYFQQVYEIVKSIPAGCVMSYGQVAALTGHPRRARQVGWALHGCPAEAAVPWHRVVAKDGRLPAQSAAGFPLQRMLLEGEGVAFDSRGRVLPGYFVRL